MRALSGVHFRISEVQDSSYTLRMDVGHSTSIDTKCCNKKDKTRSDGQGDLRRGHGNAVSMISCTSEPRRSKDKLKNTAMIGYQVNFGGEIKSSESSHRKGAYCARESREIALR